MPEFPRASIERPSRSPERNDGSREIAWLRDAYPILRHADLKLLPSDEFEGGAGGQFDLPDPENGIDRPRITITRGDADAFERLKRTRAPSVEIIARQLGVPFDQVTGEMIRQHILFHEAGHALDFLQNFARSPSPDDLMDATDLWLARQEMELSLLPVPGMHPGILREEIEDAGGFEAWRSADPTRPAICTKVSADSADALLAIQEKAYRDLEKERYADEFAVRAIKRFSGPDLARAA